MSVVAAHSPLVDVIIPTYNRRELLSQAIASIRAQTVPAARILVVDDGSTDGTRESMREAMREAGATGPQIVLIERSHGGANRARNAGVAAATSEWIAFLDSDDEWEPGKLEAQFAMLRAQPELIGVFSGVRLVGEAVERNFIPRDNPSELDLRRANVLGGTSVALIKASALREVGGFDESLPSCQDWDLWFRLRQIGPLGVVREPLVRFNSGPHERITTNREKVLSGHTVMFARLLGDVSGRGPRARVASGHRLVEAEIHRRFGAPGPALRLALHSLFAAPSRWAVGEALRSVRELLRAYPARLAAGRSRSAR